MPALLSGAELSVICGWSGDGGIVVTICLLVIDCASLHRVRLRRFGDFIGVQLRLFGDGGIGIVFSLHWGRHFIVSTRVPFRRKYIMRLF